jgi:L-ascorbate metabolism protein UlaG (beta-lactamase superfamily)
MEITWFGDTCVRLKGREGVVVADAYRSVVGPTGRGLTGDICTYSHADSSEPPRGRSKAAAASHNGTGILRPASLEPAFYLDAPGEYEVHNVLITGVRTFRDEARGAQRGLNTTFVMELDGLHAVHLGDVGHLLTEEALAELGSVDIACVSIGSGLSATKAAELVAQLDARLVVPMPIGQDETHASAELNRFLHEMGVQQAQPVSKLSVSISTVPQETTVVVLEARGRV